MRDPDAAEAAMKVHLDRVFETIRTLLVQKRDYFAAASLENLEEYALKISGSARQAKAVDGHVAR